MAMLLTGKDLWSELKLVYGEEEVNHAYEMAAILRQYLDSDAIYTVDEYVVDKMGYDIEFVMNDEELNQQATDEYDEWIKKKVYKVINRFRKYNKEEALFVILMYIVNKDYYTYIDLPTKDKPIDVTLGCEDLLYYIQEEEIKIPSNYSLCKLILYINKDNFVEEVNSRDFDKPLDEVMIDSKVVF